MRTLTEFLLARIAEDEASARNALALRGSGTDYPRGHPLDPNRAIARCAADRGLVSYAVPLIHTEYDLDSARHLSHILALLALPYADHPDYDEAWRP